MREIYDKFTIEDVLIEVTSFLAFIHTLYISYGKTIDSDFITTMIFNYFVVSAIIYIIIYILSKTVRYIINKIHN